jgi:8-oxo-dGTP diphosphatase
MPASEQGVTISHHRYSFIPRALCFVTHGQDVLLLKGAPTKKIWANKYNGLGGHIERNETVRQAAVREIAEESGLQLAEVELVGVVNIDPGAGQGIGMFVFRGQAPHRQVIPSGEGLLEWVPIADIHRYDLVEDLHQILPLALQAQRPFFAHYSYNSDDQLVIAIENTP